MGNSQSANRGSERFEGNRRLRLQHNDNVRHQCPHLADAAVTTDERLVRCHHYQCVGLRCDDTDTRVWTQGMVLHSYIRIMCLRACTCGRVCARACVCVCACVMCACVR